MSVMKNHSQEDATGWRKMGKVQYIKQLEIHTIDHWRYGKQLAGSSPKGPVDQECPSTLLYYSFRHGLILLQL